MRLLLAHGAKVNWNLKDKNGTYPSLIFASENGHSDAVKMLLKNGANANQKDEKGRTALTYAIENGHHEVVTSLIEGGAMVETGRSPLTLAIDKNHKEVVEVLLMLKGKALVNLLLIAMEDLH